MTPNTRTFVDVLLGGGHLAIGNLSITGDIREHGGWNLRPNAPVGFNGSKFVRWIGAELSPIPLKEACGTAVFARPRGLRRQRAHRDRQRASGRADPAAQGELKHPEPRLSKVASGSGASASQGTSQWASRVRAHLSESEVPPAEISFAESHDSTLESDGASSGTYSRWRKGRMVPRNFVRRRRHGRLDGSAALQSRARRIGRRRHASRESDLLHGEGLAPVAGSVASTDATHRAHAPVSNGTMNLA